MIKGLAFAYWQLKGLFRAIYDDGFDDFKATVVIGVLQVWLCFTILGLLSIAFGRNLSIILSRSGVPLGLVIGVVVFAPNYLFFMHWKSWARFEPEFKSYSTAARVLGWLMIVTVLGIDVVGLVIGGVVSRLPA
jgi:hypothetical protein